MDDLAYRSCLQHCAHLADGLSTLDLAGILSAAQARGNAGDSALLHRLIRARDGMRPLSVTPQMLQGSVLSWRASLERGLVDGHLEREVRHTLGGMDQVLDVLDLIHRGS